MEKKNEEKVKSLDAMAHAYVTEKALGPDAMQFEFIMQAVLAECDGPTVLELGYGSGHWTRRLAARGFDVTVLEGSAVIAERCRKDFGGAVKVINKLFEDFVPERTYRTIIASCVLEHVDDTARFLSLINMWLDPAGTAHIVVPNALSLHRRIGLRMRMLDHIFQLSPQEIEVGHKHVYTRDILTEQLEAAKLKVNFVQGIFVKPLSSGQMMGWPAGLFEAYNALSDELPDYTAFLYANCSKASAGGVPV